MARFGIGETFFLDERRKQQSCFNFFFFFLLFCVGVPNCRVAICDDALLVISPSEPDKKYSSKLPSNARAGDVLFEVLPLGNVTVSVDAKTGFHIVLESAGVKYKFVTYAPVSTELWLQQFERAVAESRVSHLGMDLRKVLFEEDSNIPVVVASICEALRQRGDSLKDIWLNVFAPAPEGSTFKTPLAILNSIWSGSRLFLKCPSRDLLRALHYFISHLPDSLLSEVILKEMVAARTDGRRLETLVSKITLPAQVMIGYMLGFGADLQTCSMEDEPEAEKELFCHMFANILLGSKRMRAKTDWIHSKAYDDEVELMSALMLHYPTIWRSGLRPEKVVGELKERASSDARMMMQQEQLHGKPIKDNVNRKSMRRSSISSDWHDLNASGGSIVMGKKTVHSGVFLMDSSREPSGDVPDVAWVSVLFGTVEKHYPPMRAEKLLSLFVADLNRDSKDVLEMHKCQLLTITPAGLSLPLKADTVPEPGTSLLLLCANRDPFIIGSKSSHSPDAALGEVSSVSPPASSFGSGSSPSPSSTPSSPPPMKAPTVTKNIPLRRRPDQIANRRRTNTGTGRPRSKSLESSELAIPMLSPSSPEEDTRVAPEKSVQVSSPEEEVQSRQPRSISPVPRASSSSPTEKPVPPPRARGSTPGGSLALSAGSLDVSAAQGPTSTSKIRTTSMATVPSNNSSLGNSLENAGPIPAMRMRSLSKVSKTSSAVELPRRLVTATMTSTVVTTEVSPPSSGSPSVGRLTMIQRLIGKKKGAPALPADAIGPVVWNTVKLVVVGQENVGKTHLCRQLENSK